MRFESHCHFYRWIEEWLCNKDTIACGVGRVCAGRDHHLFCSGSCSSIEVLTTSGYVCVNNQMKAVERYFPLFQLQFCRNYCLILTNESVKEILKSDSAYMWYCLFIFLNFLYIFFYVQFVCFCCLTLFVCF